jgi:hypothetical protein
VLNGRSLDNYFQKFDKLHKRPNIFTHFVWIARGILSKRWSTQANYNRFATANSTSIINPLGIHTLPAIDLLFVSKLEDLFLLKSWVNSAYVASNNPISKIVLIVPRKQQQECLVLFKSSAFSDLLVLLCEEDFVSASTTQLIKFKRPDRYGWILQQVLVAKYILESASHGVLIVDSDTLILNRQTWLDQHGNQILMPSQELHLPYYEFLLKSSSKYPEPTYSFVSHHMMVQPEILREIFSIWNGSWEDALKSALEFSNPNEPSPFDLKYEIYAQYLLNNYNNKVKFVKWANISIPRSKLKAGNLVQEQLRGLSEDYNSASFHHWNN